MEKSSFTRMTKKQGIVLPIGTKPSVFNGQLLVSTGLHELDEILGGGVAVGTVLLVEEDRHTSFYSNLMKYFLSEGLAVEHAVHFINADDETEQKKFLENLPRNLTLERQEEEEQLQQKEQEGEKDQTSATQHKGMTIAWQYEKYLTSPSTSASSTSAIKHGSLKAKTVRSFCHSYDLNRPIKPSSSLEAKNLTTFSINKLPKDTLYQDLYKNLYSLISSDFKSDIPDKTKQRNILRIGIQSIASPLWTFGSENEQRNLLQFLHALRGVLRSSLAICIITIPTQLHSPSLIRKVEHMSDTVVRFESFAGSGVAVSDAFSEYDGQFFVVKLPRLNSLVSHLPETLNYIFKLGRRKLHIEIPHLGPAETRSTKDKSADGTPKTISDLLCAPGTDKSSKIDF